MIGIRAALAGYIGKDSEIRNTRDGKALGFLPGGTLTEENPRLDYRAAMKQVLTDDPTLKAVYARSRSVSRQFDPTVDAALEVERERRVLTTT